MRISLSARHFRASENLKQFASDEVMRLKKYYDGILDCEIMLDKQKENRSCDINVKVYSTVLNASESTDDHYKSVVGAVDKLEQQLKKYKGKRKTAREGKGTSKIAVDNHEASI